LGNHAHWQQATRKHHVLLILHLVSNLAVALAQVKGRIVVVDCDLRNPMQHEIFGLNADVGLSNLLAGSVQLEEAIQNTESPNVDLISAGPVPPNPSALLTLPKMNEIIDQLKSSYNLIICDAPPVLFALDSLMLTSKVDGVILVADLNQTSRDTLRRAKEQLSQTGVALHGLICNRVKI